MLPRRLVLANVSSLFVFNLQKLYAIFSTVRMARDQAKMMGVEENSFDREEVEEVLQRYDQKKTYYIR